MFMEELCTNYNIKKTSILAHHPALNGLAERLNRRVLDTLSVIIDFQNDDWDERTSDVQCANNSSIHSSIGVTPFYALYGFDKRLPDELLMFRPRTVYYVDDYVSYKISSTYREHQCIRQNIADGTTQFTQVRYRLVKASQP